MISTKEKCFQLINRFRRIKTTVFCIHVRQIISYFRPPYCFLNPWREVAMTTITGDEDTVQVFSMAKREQVRYPKIVVLKIILRYLSDQNQKHLNAHKVS